MRDARLGSYARILLAMDSNTSRTKLRPRGAKRPLKAKNEGRPASGKSVADFVTGQVLYVSGGPDG